MSKPIVHAKSSAKKFGGKAKDYIEIHDFIDSTKAHIADSRHRALLHNTFGCFLVEKVFGHTLVNSNNDRVSTRDVAELHIIEDLGVIPSVQDWLSRMPIVDDAEFKQGTASGSALAEYIKTGHVNAHKEKIALAADLEPFLIAEFEKLDPSKVNSVRWTQYTPGFNDGEPCMFGVRDMYYATSRDHNWEEDEDKEGDGRLPEADEKKLREWIKKGYHKANEPYWPHEIPKELFELAFGDGKAIIWRRGDKELIQKDYDCGY